MLYGTGSQIKSQTIRRVQNIPLQVRGVASNQNETGGKETMKLNMPYRITKQSTENSIATATILWYASMILTLAFAVFNQLPLTLVGLFLGWCFLNNCGKWKNVARAKGWYE